MCCLFFSRTKQNMESCLHQVVTQTANNFSNDNMWWLRQQLNYLMFFCLFVFNTALKQHLIQLIKNPTDLFKQIKEQSCQVLLITAITCPHPTPQVWPIYGLFGPSKRHIKLALWHRKFPLIQPQTKLLSECLKEMNLSLYKYTRKQTLLLPQECA